MDRLKVDSILANLDATLLEARWVKGAWFRDTEAVRDNGGALPGYWGRGSFAFNTECLSNFLHRVEYGTATGEGDDYSETGDTLADKVVLKAIQHVFPGGPGPLVMREIEVAVNRDEFHKHPDGSVTVTNNGGLQAEKRLVPFGGFANIPEFNDNELTTFEDVEKVISVARQMVEQNRVPTTTARDLTLDEQYDMERQSLIAQSEIEQERLDAWEADMRKRGWFTTARASASATRRRKKEIRGLDEQLKWLEWDYDRAKEEGKVCINC